MQRSLLLSFVLAAFLALVTACARPVVPVPPHVYLVVTDNPATTMTVQYHTPTAMESMVEYDLTEPAAGGAYALRSTGTAKQIPGLPDGRHVHAVTLTGLTPETMYHFRTASGATGKFKTLPADESPLRVLFAGDIGIEPLAETFMQVAATKNPDVAVLGGDIAYDDGKLKNVGIWDAWMSNWQRYMVRDDGCMIPMVVAIGNHEVNSSDSDDPAIFAPFYTGFFAQGGSAHFVRDLSPLARVVVLDSDYLSSEAEQVPFLREALDSADEFEYLIADYHVALFPTHNSFDQDHPTAGREHWQPLFDQHDVTVAFEHHDHAFKRTKPLMGLEPHADGTVYLGDGAMGVEAREVKNADAWYIAQAEQRAHFWLADFTTEALTCQAIDEHGVTFDSVSFAPRVASTPTP